MELQSEPAQTGVEAVATSGYEAEVKYGNRGPLRRIRGAIRSVSSYVSAWLKIFAGFAFFWAKKKIEEDE